MASSINYVTHNEHIQFIKSTFENKTLEEKINILSEMLNMTDRSSIPYDWMKREVLQLRITLPLSDDDSELGNSSLNNIKQRIQALSESIQAQHSNAHSPSKRSSPSEMSSSNSEVEERFVIQRTSDDAPVSETTLIPLEQPLNADLSPLKESERNFFNNLCLSMNEPHQSSETILWRLRCLKQLLVKNENMTKEIASRIAFTYSQNFIGVKNLHEAFNYYLKASEAGCSQSIRNLVRIANELGRLSECMSVVKGHLNVPEGFFDSTIIPEKFSPKDATPREIEERFNLVTLLVSIYQKKQIDIIIERRLLDLAAAMGAPTAKQSVIETITREYAADLDYIRQTNLEWRTYLTNKFQAHSKNPAKQLLLKLNDTMRHDGYLFSKNTVLHPLTLENNASTALSRFLCFMNNKCSEGRECAKVGIKYSKITLEGDPKNPLAAWVLVAFHQLGQLQLSAIDSLLHTQYAINGQLTDPSAAQLPFFPTLSLPAPSFSFPCNDDGIEAPIFSRSLRDD